MKYKEFKKWLKSRGVNFQEGSKHSKLYFEGRQTTLPRHNGEMDERLRTAIIKQLNLDLS